MKQCIQDIVAFFKGHWIHAVAVVPAAVAFTVLHELAHCAAVWMQGGSVKDFTWLPSGEEWGHMSYSFASTARYSDTAISLAPYACWMFCCLLAGLLSLRHRPWPFWAASIIFVWLFIAPLADIANTAVPYIVLGMENDFLQAFGPVRPTFVAAAVFFGVVAASYGFVLNRRLYRARAVGLSAYCVLAAAAALIIFLISSV